MSYKDQLDPSSQRFNHTWARHKRSNSQVNGQTEMNQSKVILLSDAKARRR